MFKYAWKVTQICVLRASLLRFAHGLTRYYAYLKSGDVVTFIAIVENGN